MTTKNITVYVANDGKEFKTYEACVAHENETKEVKSLIRAMRRVSDICSSHDCYDGCPLYRPDYDGCGLADKDTPEDWRI